MSDMTVIANQYATSAEFVEKINSALLCLKKAFLKEGRGAESTNEVEQSRAELATLVEAVAARLQNEGASRTVPEELVERLRAEYGSQISWRLPDLEEAVAVLRSGEGVTERVFRTLDEICQAADATASASFRRLWRR